MRKYFLKVEVLIYIAFMTIDLFAENALLESLSVLLKLSSIFLCFLYVLSLHVRLKKNDTRLMSVIFLFTLTSDVFLLLTRSFASGVFFFVIVQALYAYRITLKGNWRLKVSVFLALATVLLMYYGSNKEAQYGGLIEIAVFYAVLFIWNIVELARSDKARYTNKRLFTIGLILYAICDIHVLIYNFPSFFQTNILLEVWYAFSGIGMWLFYLPGQVMLSMSAQVDGDTVS